MLNTRLCRLMSLSIGEGVHLSTTKIQLVFVVFPVENARTRGANTLDNRHETRTVCSFALLQTTTNHSMSAARQNLPRSGRKSSLTTTKIQFVFVVFPVENARTRGSKTLDRHETRTVRSLALLLTTANHSMSPARQNLPRSGRKSSLTLTCPQPKFNWFSWFFEWKMPELEGQRR